MAVGFSSEAIMFFNDGDVVKEMLYPEFEAILDHVVGIAEFENMQVPSAYVRINERLKVTHVVLFLLEFDDDGYVERSWNIPLSHLADNAGRGPDLGAGPIKLSCRSQCSVSWHQRSLWDPDAHAGNTTLKKIAAAAKRNKLCLTVIDDLEESTTKFATVDKKSAAGKPGVQSVDARQLEKEITEKLTKKFQDELQKRLSAQQEEHRLRVATMKSEAKDHLAKLQALYRNETEKIKATLDTTKHLFAEEKHRNLQLKNTLDEQADELKNVREKFQKQMVQSKEVGQQQLLELEERFELEYKAKLDKATAELKEMLDMREVELFYRDEQVGRLNAEVSALRQEKQDLLDTSGDRVLQRLVDSGITFVAYQPGIDHLTIPMRDMAQYLESPVDYVAEKSAVDKVLYKQWYEHYQSPVCNHRNEQGDTCGAPIAKVPKPSRFIAGESDRCSKHNHAATKLTTLIKAREGS